jgi:hypothetical protein
MIAEPKIRIFKKLVRLEASTKPHVQYKFEIFWTNIASTMGCPNSKNRPKKGLCLLGVKKYIPFEENFVIVILHSFVNKAESDKLRLRQYRPLKH